MSEQDYIPGTTVIRNLIDRDRDHPYGTADQRYLDRAETMFVSERLGELGKKPVPGQFTFGHMREIHRHLFQDVYAWAGEPRRTTMQKRGTDYADPADMPALLRKQYTSLAEQDYLRGINDREEFTRRLATLWGEINHGHSFREGNTRSQTVFFEQLAHSAGWTLDVAQLAPEHPISFYRPFVDARFEHQRIRSVEGISSDEAALDLANVLYKLVERDPSPEGQRRRGVTSADPAPRDPARIVSRDPERGAKLLRHESESAAAKPVKAARPPAPAVAEKSLEEIIEARMRRFPELRGVTSDPSSSSTARGREDDDAFQP